MKLTGKLLIKLWTVLTVTLLVALAVAYYLETARSFFLLLNILNAPFYLAALLFRRRIDDWCRLIDETFQQLATASRTTAVNLTYAHEKPVGLTFVLLTAFVGLYVFFLVFSDTAAYFTLIDEDGLVEYASAVFWIIGAVFLAIYILRSDKAEHAYKLQNLPYLLILLFFVVAAGEETSWGQRIFDIETPDAIKAVNVQNELNFHNIGSISVFSNAFFLIAVGFFLIAPYIRATKPQLRYFLDYFNLPVPNRYAVWTFVITLVVWLVVGIRYGTLGFHPFSFYAENYYTQMDDEIFECLTAWSFLSFSVLNVLKTRSVEPVDPPA